MTNKTRSSFGAASRPRVCFLYATSAKLRLRQFTSGGVPSHRLYGFVGLGSNGFESVAANLRLDALNGRVWPLSQLLWCLMNQKRVAIFVAGTEAAGLPLLLASRVGLVRRPIIVISVALTHEKNNHGFRLYLWKLALPSAARLIVYAKSQIAELSDRFEVAKGRITFFPLGVDSSFDEAIERVPADDWILSVGAEDARDFRTLFEAIPTNMRAKIVTDNLNATALLASGLVPDSRVDVLVDVPRRELGRLYKTALCTVLPLKPVNHSVGQTVLLESIACGCPVVATAIAALDEYPGQSWGVYRTPHGDSQSMRDRIVSFGEIVTMGGSGAVRLPPEFDIGAFDEHLAGQIREVLG